MPADAFHKILNAVAEKFPDTRHFIAEKVFEALFPGMELPIHGPPAQGAMGVYLPELDVYSIHTMHKSELSGRVFKYIPPDQAFSVYITMTKELMDCFPDKKIHAIKEVRTQTNLGLKEAKDFVEALMSKIVY